MEEVMVSSNKLTALQPWGPQPIQAYMLEVGIDKHGTKIVIGYKRFWKSPKFNAATAHDEFLAWVNDQVAKPSDGIKLKLHPGSSIRKPTKMSFQCRELTYLVLKLEDAVDWRFTVDGPPLTMDGIWHKKDVFFAPKRADELAKHGNKYAYAVADCPKGTSKPGSNEIEARFNLHVDFLEGGEADAYIPIVIDPDVRYPGGNGP